MSTIRNNHFSLFFAIFFLLCTFHIAKSQVCTFTLGPDRTACFGSPLDRILYAPLGMNKYYWNNVEGTSSYTVTSTGTYTCKVEVESGLNLIQNPDFNAGATGFTSTYINKTGIPNGVYPEGTYAITSSANLVHNNFSQYYDHTVGTPAGNYMVVNGSISATPINVWCQNITVNTYTSYNFSAWAMTIVGSSASQLAALQFTINGNQIGNIFSPPLTNGQWAQFNATWFSSITTNANICITNQNNVGSGNDFGIDDISYKEMCVASDTIKLTVARPILNAGLDKIICKQDSVLLAATTNTTYSTVWSPTIGVSNPSILQPNVSPPNTTTYTITVTDVNSCTASDKVIVSIRPNSEFDLGNDTTLCPGQLLHLQPTFSSTYSQLTWNDNSTDPDLIINSSGKYYATSDRNGCKYSDTINVAYTNIPGFTLPADITTCITNAPINMSTGIVGRPDITYKWSSGENTNNININASGTYIATITLGNCSERDSINITLNNPITFSLGPDTVLCPGTSLQLNSGTPSNITSWQNGQTGNTFNVTQAGTYTATVNNTCITQSSVRVAYETLPIIDLGTDKIICENDSVELIVDPKGNTVLWNTGSTKNTIVVGDEGNYTVTVFTKHCKTTDTVAVQEVAIPVIELGNDTTICSNTEIILKVDNTNVDITWNDGSTNDYLIANKEGTYWCEITNNVCAPVYDTLVLSTKNCDCNVYIPNSFSPDNSGTNELFGVYTICAISDFNLKIFNRWGDLLFETGDPAVKWDGTFRGKKLETGVYVYKVKFRPFDYSGKIPEIETRVGQIHILK